MKLIWEIKSSPNATNSNEKAEGSVFIDDRLYGIDLFSVGVASTFLTPQLFSKPTNSNTLDISPASAYNGDKLIIDTICAKN